MARVLFILLGGLFFGGALLIFLPAETAQTMTQILGLLFWVVVALWWWGRSTKKNETTTFKTDAEPLEFFYDICLQALEDHRISSDEARQIQSWCASNPDIIADNLLARNISLAVDTAFEDQRLSEQERNEIRVLLTEFCSSRESSEDTMIDRNPMKLEGWRDIEVGSSYFIEYADAAGNKTERIVKVSGVDSAYLQGFCKMRRGGRTFRIDRIISLADLSTGEILVQ